MKKPHTSSHSDGFTVVELLIATAVFSVVLLVCSIGLIQISRTFYKGITVTRTQEVARAVVDDVASSVEFSSSNVVTLSPNNGSLGYCVGNTRYSYRLYQKLPDSGTPHVFVADKPAVCSGSAQDLQGSLTANSRELLSPSMRVSKFTITANSNRLYSINIKLASGDDDLLANYGNANATCSGILAGTQFCATVELTTVVQKRVQ